MSGVYRTHLYEPVGRCIYCGTAAYANDSSRSLAKEHIIPEALNGSLVLPQAVCCQCEQIICRWESKLLRGALLGCRTYLGLRTKRPSKRPKTLPLFDPRTKPNAKIPIPIEDYPASLLLVLFGPPGLLAGEPYGRAGTGVWIHSFNDTREVLASRYGLDQFATSSLDTFALCRTLAKIAHSFAVASLGLDGFGHLLPEYIIGDRDECRRHYVGSLPELQPPNPDAFHEIDLEEEQKGHIVVRIRLFASLGAPTYRVVVGRTGNSNIREAAPLAARGA